MPNFARLSRRHSVAVPCVKHLCEINKNSKCVTPLSKDDLMDKFYHQMNSTEDDCRKSHELDKLIPVSDYFVRILGRSTIILWLRILV